MLRTRPDWNGWKYCYDDKELRILSYPKYDYEINIGELPQPYRFYIKDIFQRVIEDFGLWTNPAPISEMICAIKCIKALAFSRFLVS